MPALFIIDDPSCPVVGEPEPFTFACFADVNPELDPDERACILALRVGETYTGGGGAAAEWQLTRVR